MTDQTILAYVGTYTQGDSEGIYILRFDPATGAFQPRDAVGGIDNPSFLALHPGGRHLYAVSETGEPGGAVQAYAIAPDGGLRPLNRRPSQGTAPCHLSVDPSGRCLLVANYGSGTLCALRIQPDGSLAGAGDVVAHHGSGPHPTRQEGPHAHSLTPDPSGRYALACDLGLDRVFVYRLDAATARLVPHDPPYLALAPGSGPRHLAFGPSGRHAYVINELNSTITACAWSTDRGTLEPLQTLSTLPEGYAGENTGADVHVAPSGRHVYGSNRGHDSVAAYAVDEGSGRLRSIGHTPVGGSCPRGLALCAQGRWLLACNQLSDSIVTFEIEADSGQLRAAGPLARVPSPVCLRFHTLPC